MENQGSTLFLQSILGDLPIDIQISMVSSGTIETLSTRKAITTTSPENVLYKAKNNEIICELDALNYIAWRLEEVFKENAKVRIFMIKTKSNVLVTWVNAYIKNEKYLSIYYDLTNTPALKFQEFPNSYRMVRFFKELYNLEEDLLVYMIPKYVVFNKDIQSFISNEVLINNNLVGKMSYTEDLSMYDDVVVEFTSQPGGIPPTGATDAMMVQYGYNNAFTGDMSAGTTMKPVKLSTGENEKDKKDRKDMVDRFFNIYAYTGKKKKKKDAATVYESLCGRKMLTPDQIEYDKDFRLVNLTNQSEYKSALSNVIKECQSFDPSNLPDEYLPLISIEDKNIAKCKLVDHPTCQILTDNDGYFMIDMTTGKRSQSVENIADLDPSIVLEDAGNEFDSVKSEVDYFNKGGNQQVIYDPKDLNDLEDQYNKYSSLHHDEKQISDDKSIALFGKSNEDRYRAIKSKFLNSRIDNKYINLVEASGSVKFNLLSLENIEKAKNAQISLEDADFKFKEIKKWSLNTGIYIMVPCQDTSQLNDLYNKFSSMPKILKRISDWKLLENIGCNNESFYNFQKSIMESHSAAHFYPLPLIESVQMEEAEFPATNLPLDIPFYSPYELKSFIDNKPLASKSIIDKDKIADWLKEYTKIYNGKKFNRQKLVEWVSTIRNLTFKLYEQQVDDSDNVIKESLLELGWNPYLEFTIDNRTRAYKRVKSIKVNETVQELLKESKDLPVQFDNYGNLLITKPEKVDIDKEYFESHRLLKSYKESKNIDGIKFELCRLWYLNTIAENKIYTKKLDKDELKAVNTSRARILNDFNKYIKIVLKEDKNFNFNNFYAKSKFDDKQIRVNRSTLKYSYEYIKKVLKDIL